MPQFFNVHHTFKPDMASKFFDYVGSLKPEDWEALAKKNEGNGMWNHSFSPCSPEGPCFCVWESKEDMDIAEFQKFIDGPDGPGPGHFVNAVHKHMDGFPTPFPSHWQQAAGN